MNCWRRPSRYKPFAIGTQIIYYVVLGVTSCLLAIGPALATLMGVADAPWGAITMCILAIFLGAILSGFATAPALKRFCAPAGAT